MLSSFFCTYLIPISSHDRTCTGGMFIAMHDWGQRGSLPYFHVAELSSALDRRVPCFVADLSRLPLRLSLRAVWPAEWASGKARAPPVGIGLSVGSTAPAWRDASCALVLLSALYVVLAALASYGLGGYVVGLMCTRPSSREDADSRDGLHGLLVWALATLLTAVIGFATAQSLTRLAAPSGAQTGPSTSIGGENLIAHDLDRLFLAEQRPDADLEYARAEAARILLTTSSRRGMQPADGAYLVRLTIANTGLSQPDAERRADEVAARAKGNISRARTSSVIVAFTAAAAALLGAAVSWFAACAGGRIRDGEAPPHALLDWGRPAKPT
jgi:hypothetical protein